MTRKLSNLCFYAVFLLATSCGGGGGGGGGATSNDTGGSLKRSTDTAVRLIHSNIIAAPIVIKVADRVVQQARYGQERFYQNVGSGLAELQLQQLNGTLLASIPVDFADRTEYTVLALSGRNSQPLFKVLTDNVEPADSGFNYVRIVHGIKSSGDISAEVGGVSFATLSSGTASEFTLVPAGEVVLTARSGSGAIVAQKTIALADRGETTILLTGDASVGFVVVQLYEDLD